MSIHPLLVWNVEKTTTVQDGILWRRIGTRVPGTGKLDQKQGFLVVNTETMAGTTRLELATSAVTGRRSNQLSYVPKRKTSLTEDSVGLKWQVGACGKIAKRCLAIAGFLLVGAMGGPGSPDHGDRVQTCNGPAEGGNAQANVEDEHDDGPDYGAVQHAKRAQEESQYQGTRQHSCDFSFLRDLRG